MIRYVFFLKGETLRYIIFFNLRYFQIFPTQWPAVQKMKLVDMVGYMNEYYEPVLQMEKFSNWKAKVVRDCVVVTWPRYVIGLKKKTAPFS